MDRLDQVREELREFVRERNWAQFHDPKNLAMAIASEAGELLAEYRWVPNGEADTATRDSGRRNRIEAEAADVGIALLLFCERANIDLLHAIGEKIKTNRDNYPVAASQGKAERPSTDR